MRPSSRNQVIRLGAPTVEQLPLIDAEKFIEAMSGLGICKEADPNLFYIEKGDNKSEKIEAARKICRRCVINSSCLNYALVNADEQGIWGGTTEDERKSIRRENNRRRLVELSSKY